MNYKNIDISKIKIKNKIIEYNGKRGLRILTPKMRIPFGLDNEYGKYLLKMEFTNVYDNDEMKEFFEFINNLEKFFKSCHGNEGIFKSQIRRSKAY